MKNKYRNIFLAFGIVAVLIMIFTFDMDYQELWANLKRAGVYLPLVLLLWLFVYLINTTSWYIIIRSGGKPGFSFARLYKFTVTGFALNYVTPVGLMGGEPYRIMELKPYIGVERATSSVILYVMMHIFSHFCFLAEFCLAIPLPLSGRVGDGNHFGYDHRLLPAGSYVVCKRLSAWDGSCFRSSGQSSSFSEKESNPFCRLPSGNSWRT